MKRSILSCVVGLGLLTTLLGPEALAGQGAGDRACLTCHGAPEFLRQQAPDRERALALHVEASVLAGSAHTGVTCAECHTGFESSPHPTTATTETCASCHEAVEPEWDAGVHAESTELEPVAADCTACHGVHDVGFVSDSLGVVDIPAMNATCAACHVENVLPTADPHAADSVGCFGCHSAHDTRPVDQADSWLHPRNQVSEGCVACHQEQVDEARTDAHYIAVRSGERIHGHEAPACTGCHGGHQLAGPELAPNRIDQMAVCGECHEEYVESFADSYHGQATALGSTVAATCSDCHTGHLVFETADERSSVHESRIVETCAACHEGANESFAGFQPHANHHDREKYPHAWWSYHLMTGLLITTFGIFGIHTGLWLVRLTINGLRMPREEDAS